MAVTRSVDIEDVLNAMTAAWREGDAQALLAYAADEAAILIGNPGSFPVAVGPEAVAGVINTFVPMSKDPQAGKAYFPDIHAYADGDFGWVYAEGYLELPGKGRHGFRNSLVLRREAGAWRWLQWCAFMPVPMHLMGTETLGFI